MTVLRNPHYAADFKIVTNKMFRSLKSTPEGKIDPELTLQQLQHKLAVAMGARSLEAFYAAAQANTPDKDTAKSAKDTAFDAYWNNATTRWCVLTYLFNTPKGELRLAAHGQSMKGLGTSTRPILEPNDDTSLPDSYYGPISNGLIVVDLAQANDWLLKQTLNDLPVNAVPNSGKVMLLSMYAPGLFPLLMAGEHNIDMFLYADNWTYAFNLGFVQEDYYHERDEGNTNLTYAKWTSHQLESWIDDLLVNRG